MTPASVTASSRRRFCTVTRNHVNAPKNTAYPRTCISSNLPKQLKVLSASRFLSPLPPQPQPLHSPCRRFLPEEAERPPSPGGTSWTAPGSTATAAFLGVRSEEHTSEL